MAHSGRERHRDRDPGSRHFDGESAPASDRVFRITDDQRQQIAACLRDIDEARRLIEARHSAENREIVRELRAAADAIYEVLNTLDEADIP